MLSSYNQSTMGDAETIRPPASAHLMVTSMDRYNTANDMVLNPTPATEFTINRGNYILQGYFNRLAISQIQFFWNIPNITVFNNFMSVKIAGTDLSGSIFTGNYSGPQLAQSLQALITNHPSYNPAWVFEVVYNDLSGTIVGPADKAKFNFSVAAPYTMSFNYANIPGIASIRALGLYNTLQLNGQIDKPATQFITSGYTTMLYTRYVDICSDKLTKFQRVKDTTTEVSQTPPNVIARIYAVPPNVAQNPAQPGQLFSEPWVMTIDYNTPKYIRWSPEEALNQIDFRVFDEFGNPLYWDNENSNWEFMMTILASES